ncbi:MAG: FKBP-type peptidyl-prolyl cis-trans isomerase [Muribaculaceae bacterium]|nr:FKBP-type peptidyl-prolyl cis-trans isomerase [Muribaculaceae bacterium]
MKKFAILALCLTLAVPATFAKKAKKGSVKTEQKSETSCCKATTLNSLQDSIAYAYGMAMGKQTVGMLEQMKNDVDFCLSKDIIISSMMTQLANDSANMLFTDEQLADVYSRTNNILRDAMQKKKEMEMENNKRASAEFLAKMEQEPGVVKTESGLLYKVDRLGEGEKPEITSLVQVHYVGRLMDGTEFDSSYKRGKPADFSLQGLIKGWQEGICLMPVGSKYTFYIPYELGYGEHGQGPIPPASTLIFEVELLEVTK